MEQFIAAREKPLYQGGLWPVVTKTDLTLVSLATTPTTIPERHLALLLEAAEASWPELKR